LQRIFAAFASPKRRRPVFRIGPTIDDSGADVFFPVSCQGKEKDLHHASAICFVHALTWPRTAVNAWVPVANCKRKKKMHVELSETPGASRRQPEARASVSNYGARKEGIHLYATAVVLPAIGSNVLGHRYGDLHGGGVTQSGNMHRAPFQI
jgi:hypothetical protein